MAYATVQQLRQFADITLNVDDNILVMLLEAVTVQIDNHTKRTFDVQTDTTRTISTYCADGYTLYLPDDLCQISKVTNDADGTATEVLSSEYVTNPRNDTPYFQIKILSSSGKYWAYTNDAEMGIEIEGRWGYSTNTPADINLAAQQWALYAYRQKDAQVFDVVAQPEMGQITIPKGIPANVTKTLRPYVRQV